MVLCSDTTEVMKSIDYIAEKLLNSGFKAEEIKMAKDKALQIDRNQILSADRSQQKSESTENKQLTFLINRDGFMCKQIKKIVKDCQNDVERLLGKKTRIIVAESHLSQAI